MLSPDPQPRRMAPWEYVRKRRKAARLTIAHAARPFWQRDDHRDDCERNLARLESEGFITPRIADLDLPRAFPFDPAIYAQLATADSFLDPRLCALCAWDDRTPEIDLRGEPARWADQPGSTCTRCEQLIENRKEAA